MNKLTITKKITLAAAALGFAFSVNANNYSESVNYQQALANLISAQSKQVMQEVTVTVSQSIDKNLSEFNFLSALTWAKANTEEALTVNTNIVAKATKTTEE